ncbi:MAG: hypothetical protein ABIL58_04640 [Pseudomonadota bacterium]
MKKIFAINLAILTVILGLALSTSSAATIVPGIDIDHALRPDGTLTIEAYLSNEGDVPLHHATATIFFADQASRSGDLGNCRPENEVAFTASFGADQVTPGDYMAMVRFNYEEPSGRTHRSFHTQLIRIPGGDNVNVKTLLESAAQVPTFNTKAFWKNEDHLRLVLKNGHKQPITPHIVFYLPNAIFAPHDTLRPTLTPGENATIDIPLVYTGEFQNGGAFIAVAQYELDGRHYAMTIRGDVMVISKPVLFKGYVIASLLIFIFAGAFFMRQPKVKSEAI